MTKNASISLKIKALVDSGMSLKQAIDEVLGAGTFDRIASEVYDSLRK